ncbi:hypothetical protein ACFSMW_05960 [Virgibacillus halophilus]|uniref:PEP-CTERM protein-sorting domain-containing protein n=1 Tax=Tigheibacillus halophilus TaxID=361280 RepID=A0ABU5CBQ0_9BACI|nr:hypothetical protein [Virgibacillus halophilus]
MKSLLLTIGIIVTIGFGGSFLIRLIRDSAFYISYFLGGVIGIIILIIGMFATGKRKS